MRNEEFDCRDRTGNAKNRGNGPNRRHGRSAPLRSAIIDFRKVWKGPGRRSYDAGFGARSPPWEVADRSFRTAVANPRQTPLCDGLRSASAQGGTTSRPSNEEHPLSSMEDGEGVRKRRRCNDHSDASEYERPPPKTFKADLTDAPYEPPSGARQEVNARSFLQQVTVIPRVSLFGRSKHASDSVKQVINPIYISIDSNSIFAETHCLRRRDQSTGRTSSTVISNLRNFVSLPPERLLLWT
jgi:hypothetical protein